ncbi:hypothetical protein MHBO_001462 [Bonamia ostreae]|uniref:L-seryl-tRNA(Sec) kinase n=1 Tax=Bonamia ostreae TaxID=126728 RepID=A0ABV2AJX3_9EUKA
MSKLVILLIGIPGAGKTSLANKIKSQIKNFDLCRIDETVNVKIISYDSIEKELMAQNKFQPNFYQNLNSQKFSNKIDSSILNKPKSNKNNDFSKIWKQTRKKAFEMFKNLNSTSKNIIILDDNFYLFSMRKPFIRYCAVTKTPLILIYLKTDFKTAKIRNELRTETESVPEDIIDKMFDKIKINKIEKTNTLIIENNTKNGDFEKIKIFIEKSFRKQNFPIFKTGKIEKNVKLEKTPSQLLDLKIRKLINKKMLQIVLFLTKRRKLKIKSILRNSAPWKKRNLKENWIK